MPQITGKLTLTLHYTFSCFIIYYPRLVPTVGGFAWW